MTLLWSHNFLKIDVFKQLLAFDIGKYHLWLRKSITHDILNLSLMANATIDKFYIHINFN